MSSCLLHLLLRLFELLADLKESASVSENNNNNHASVYFDALKMHMQWIRQLFHQIKRQIGNCLLHVFELHLLLEQFA